MSMLQPILANARVKTALRQLQSQVEPLVDLAIAVQQIPAPTFYEHERAKFVGQQFSEIGLKQVEVDTMGNVFGRLVGLTDGAPVIASAHSDTVFSAETDLTHRRENGRVFGPGIADNSAGVAGLLQLARTMVQHELVPQRDVWFVVNVGEEGLGDLLGMREVTRRFQRAHAFIVIEGGMFGYLLHEAIGVRRYRVAVKTDGGHSWSDFGQKSAVHIAAHLIARLDRIQLPEKPKTTLNVGVLNGGTTVNTIASSAEFLLDLRSEDPAALRQLIGAVQRVLEQANHEYGGVVSAEKIGDRPAGYISRRTRLVRQADAALRAVGCEQIHYLRGSTDANIPLSFGLPAVCIGLAKSANAHRLDEYLDIKHLSRGMQQLLLLTLAAADFSD